MADILIRGMEMPRNGRLISIYRSCGRLRAYVYGSDPTELHEVIELPPHGDLIDLDAVVDYMYYDDMYEEWSLRTVTVRDVLYNCVEKAMPPVIVPSNKEETE